jgi:hypothetical protein
MTREAKEAFEKAMSERRELIAQRALWRALGDYRKKAETIDVREALKELKLRKISHRSLVVQIVAFFLCLTRIFRIDHQWRCVFLHNQLFGTNHG